VGGGNNTITAGTGSDVVVILGLDSNNTATLVLAGANNQVTATYENVTVSGTAATGNASITLGNGANNVTLSGDANSVTVGSGRNAITLSGNANQVSVTDTTGGGSDAINLNAGNADVVTLGSAGGTVTDSGVGTTTITQTVSATAAVDVSLNAGGVITLGNGKDTVTSGANSQVTIGNGNDTASVGAGSTLLAGAGRDTFTIGDNATLGVFGSNTSKATINLGNDDVVGVTGGQVITHDSVGNDLLYLDGVSNSSTVSFTNLDDSVVLGLNASGHVFLNPSGGDLVEIQAPDATGAYAGTVDISDFSNDIMYLGSLRGGKSGEALNSFSAVLDNITQSGAKQILSLEGGGKVIFEGKVQLSQSEFAFTTNFGPVVPSGL
jgi:hypothetical protein